MEAAGKLCDALRGNPPVVRIAPEPLVCLRIRIMSSPQIMAYELSFEAHETATWIWW
jgi:hypothetical protein